MNSTEKKPNWNMVQVLSLIIITALPNVLSFMEEEGVALQSGRLNRAAASAEHVYDGTLWCLHIPMYQDLRGDFIRP